MLYRFQSAQSPFLKTTKWWHFHRFGGSFARGALACDVEAPRPAIPERSRFYFTLAGYKRNVKLIKEDAKAQGQILRVIRIKEPEASRIVYRDRYQVALLPPSRKRHGKNKIRALGD